MKAIVVKRVGAFEFVDIDKPQPAVSEVLVKVEVAGLCRTDLKIIEVGHHDLILPRIPAEEVVGTVCEAGLDVNGEILGKRVYVYPGTSCGKCRACSKGAENLCESMQIMGFHRDGGFAEYVVAPAKSLIEIPDHTCFEDAVFAEPLSCCLNALELARLESKETIAIWGAGPAGNLLALASQAVGAKPVIVEPDERRRKMVQGLASAPEDNFDVAIVAVGSSKAYGEAINHLNPRGRLVIFSGLPLDKCKLSLDFNQLHYHEQSLIGAYGCSYRHGKQALEWISQKRIIVNDIVSHRLPLRELGKALDLVRKRQGMKILLYPHGVG